MRQQVKAAQPKISSQTICHVCHGTAYQELWRNGGRLYETVICKRCGEERGRINGGTWHLLEKLEGGEIQCP